MSDLAQRLAGLSPAQRALLEKRLAKDKPPGAEPIAIIGMACRFPGAPDLNAYWRLIHDRVNASVEIPAERWDCEEFFDPSGEASGKMSVRWAALVDQPDQFDPQFFGITPREAARMDPQQRLLLEVAWEAMENSGRPADRMAGTRTAVFVGIGGTDYSKVAVPYDDYYCHIDAHMGTGNALSIAANRLSYIFDFHGPSAAVDTACSSSSLAIHFAVESLRRRESDAALAGGVNMILTPETTIAFSKARMLSPDGVCRPFDANANGYVRGEGCGLVMLKRLADAERDGDNILAVLRATSVNQDGRTSGISAPNSQSQVACIRAALAQAGLTPDDIGYIEAHGTGTPLGDPIEMQALGEIFRARGSDDPPAYVASVKANVGHMETVSGVAGLIKVVLMLQRGEIVPQTNFEALNPHIRFDGTRLRIPTEPIAWPSGARPRRAGVSSFGFGGTNTHLILESPSAALRTSAATASSIDRPRHILKLAGKSESSLARQAADLASYLAENPARAVADVCYSANTGRADFNYRAAVSAESAEQLRERLTQFASGQQASGIKQATVRTLGRTKVAFLFTGQGLQYAGMGRGLYASQPVFRATIDACDEILREIWEGESLVDIVYPRDCTAPDDPAALVHQTEYTQPALFALECALAELWRSWGVKPDIVLGHSVGEYAAACVAGIMSLEQGLALIAERARLMQGVKRHGKMAVVFAAPDRVAREIERAGSDVVVAVQNGPENVVISGDANAVTAMADRFQHGGIDVKTLNVSHAFHSPLMDEMLDEFERFAAKITFHAPQIPLVSNLTGGVMCDAPSARYWRDHLRSTVQFAAGMARIAEAKPTAVIEIGPTASLLGMGRRCVPELETAWLPSIRQGQDNWQTICDSVSEYYVRGGRIDWRHWDAPWKRQRLLIPNYPFERSRHWYTLNPALRRSFSSVGGATLPASSESSGHPLLGARLSTVWANSLFETSLTARSPAYLIDHQVQGSPVAPAAAYIELGLAAAEQAFGQGRHGLANIAIQQAMFLPEGVSRRVQTSVAPESGGQSTFEVYSRASGEEDQDASWAMHASGQLVHETHVASNSDPTVSSTAQNTIDLEGVRSSAIDVVPGADFYQLMRERGLAYGPSFQVLDRLHRGAEGAIAEVVLPESVRREAPRYRLHPVLGDALLQAMAGAVPLEADGTFSPFTYMPVVVRQVRVHQTIVDFSQQLFVVARRTSGESNPSPERVEGDVWLTNASGEWLVAFEGVIVQRLGRSGAHQEGDDTSHWLYRIEWQPQALGPSASQVNRASEIAVDDGAWLVFSDRRGIGQQLAERLEKHGQQCLLVEAADHLKLPGESSDNGRQMRRDVAKIDPLDESHYRQLLTSAFVDRKRTCLGVVHLWSLDIPMLDALSSACHDSATIETKVPADRSPEAARDASDDVWKDSRRLATGSAIQLFRALSRANLSKAPEVWLVTAGAQSIDADRTTPAKVSVEQSPLIGLGRVAALELPDFSPKLVDLDPANLSSVDLANELLATSKNSENQVAYWAAKRYVARLVRDESISRAKAEGESTALAIPRGKAYQLRITQPGSFDALRYSPVEREKPQSGQVEIEIHATGLNFSDVLKALGLYPGIKDAIVPLGIEASGIVTAVGDGVDRFRVGDAVLGVVPYAFASHARTAEYALVHKPVSIDHDEACTIPITFLTAYYGLVRLAHLQPGERLLIHAGAGGVGLAAIQIAKRIGAEIFATAGSDEKREFLRSLGVKHVYSSRSTEFAEAILNDTDREGVDVVLNSLPGEAITKSLSILRAYGRFLEIGKIDIYQNRMIGLLPFQDNLSYFAIDLDRMLRQRPEYIRELFAEVMEYFEAGDYQPLMFTRFEAEQTIDAFRYMSQRKNIGKIVVAIEQNAGAPSRVEVDSPPAPNRIARRDGAYLLSGGLGALGLQVAEWLADEGAGAIVLLARRSPTPEIQARIARIEAKGAKVVALQGDVADSQSVDRALLQIPVDFPPLRGVIHAAGVLADGVLSDMTLEQLDQALSPKVDGAWNLHRATIASPLDFFVLFSSVASILGSPGQANYAAGNAMLDALAHYRRGAGLPATSINWGPWSGSGMAAQAGRDEAVKSRGMELIPPDQGLAVLGQLLRGGATQLTVMNAHWKDMLRLMGSRRPALLADIAEEAADTNGGEAAGRVDHAFRKQLFDSAESQRQTLVAEYIRLELARIMGVESTRLATDQPLSTFGLDSLLALELKNNLESRLDFTLPMAKLMEGPTIDSLAIETVKLLDGEGTASRGSTGDRDVEAWTPLLALRTTGTRPPLILLPALGGDVRCYADLVQHLGDDQPIYAFRPRGVDQDLPPHLTMKEMIADYLSALQDLLPTGPYFLGGWSTGGIYAHALADALQQAGDEVALLALFDSPLPSICDDIDVDDDARFLCDLVNFANCFSGTNARVDYEQLRVLDSEQRFQTVLAEARTQGTIPAEASEEFIRRLVHVGEANVRAIQSYKPRQVKAPVHLFVPTTKGGLADVSGKAMPEDLDNGWRNEIGQALDIHDVPGDHFTMMIDDSAAQIAQQISAIVNADRTVRAGR